jgi:hypothetical protein
MCERLTTQLSKAAPSERLNVLDRLPVALKKIGHHFGFFLIRDVV